MVTYLKRLSPSSINTFQNCPAQWNYRYITHEGGIYLETPHIDLGTYAHNAIEKYFGSAATKPKREIEITQRIDICFAEVIGDKFRSMPSIQTKLNKVIKNFKEFELRRASKWKVYLPTFIEKDLRNDNFRGLIDFYSEPEATVIDWKTGYKQDITQQDIIQGEVYRNLLTTHDYPVNKIYFVSLGLGKMLEVPRQRDGFIEDELFKTKYSISQDDFPARPNQWCYNCTYQIQCEFRDINLWDDYIW